ncbi:MAG TPA: TonB-dependent receptor [Gemmatimonadaceae bacterium]
MAAATAAATITSLARPSMAGAQSTCAPANRASVTPASYYDDALSKPVSLRGREISLRDALDRLAAAAHVRISYSAEALDLSKPVCLEYDSQPVVAILNDLLAGAPVRPVLLGADQIVLAPAPPQRITAAEPASATLKTVGMLDRVVVTGSTVAASQRALPIALDVVQGSQLAEHGQTSMSGSLDGVVPGLWIWEQSPLSLLARYGSIRGASSLGVSYPKVYVDGIEVANSLLVTHLDPESVSRIEVIRGPQGAALYGADAISGVVNIITRNDGVEGGAARAQISSAGGAASSDYSGSSVFVQSHAVSLRAGTNAKSGRLGMTLSTLGPFIPGASSQQLTANGGLRFVHSRGVINGTFRFFAQDARTPASPVLAGLDLWSPEAYLQAENPRRTVGPGQTTVAPQDAATRQRLDSLLRLVMLDSSDRQSVRQFTTGVSGTYAQDTRWTHSAVAGVDGYRLRSASILDGAFPSALDSALRAATGSAIRTTFRASTVGQFGNPAAAAATVTIAAEHSYVRDETVTRNPFSVFERTGELRGKLVESRTNAGFIGQLSASFKGKLFASGGLRVERNSGLTGIGDIATLPMLGASAVQSIGIGTLKLRAAYGKGIRPPQTSSRAGMLMGLTGDLSPEEQSGIETGADLFFGRSASLHVTRFDQKASGLIQPVTIYVAAENDVNPQYRRILYQLQNVGEITNKGWELSGSVADGPFTVSGTFSQVDSRVAKLAARYTGDLRPGDRMLEVPARTVGLSAGYAQGRLSMSWRVSRASDWINYNRLALLTAFASEENDIQKFVGSELRSYWAQYDGVTRLGGRVGVAISRGMTFTLDGDNLLDEQRGEPDNVTVLPGRTLTAGLRVKF